MVRALVAIVWLSGLLAIVWLWRLCGRRYRAATPVVVERWQRIAQDLIDRAVVVRWRRIVVRLFVVLERWRPIVRHFLRVRRLQRLWGHIGQALQAYPEGLRARLRDTDPTAHTRVPVRRRRQLLN